MTPPEAERLMSQATHHGPGQGERHELGPATLVIKATGEDTAGSFYLGETVVSPGFRGPPPHVHERLHDMFYVLEGTLTLLLGDEEVAAEAGTFVCVPPGVVHTFSNRSEADARFLNFNTPSGWENYMRDLSEASAQGRKLLPEEIGRIASRYDFHPAPPGLSS